jgi:hypothetical protein
MNLLRNDPPIIYRAPGYQVDLDRLQPIRGAGCGRVVLLFAAAGSILAVVCGGVYMMFRSQTTPAESVTILTLVPSSTPLTSTPTPPPLDSWSLTGTALLFAIASPTIDYCWFLTPTPVPTFTPLPVTPDAWALQGTAYALQTGTPTTTQIPTQSPPRAWCDLQPTATTTPPVTATKAETTEEPVAVRYTPAPKPIEKPVAASTPITAPDSYQQPAQYSQPAQPQVVVQTRVIVQTAAPPVATQRPVMIVVTATPQPTATPTETPTETPTDVPTETPTETPAPLATQESLP